MSDSPSPKEDGGKSITEQNPSSKLFLDTSDWKATVVTLDESLERCFTDQLKMRQNNTRLDILLVLSAVSIIITVGLHALEYFYSYSAFNEYTIPCVVTFFALQFLMGYILPTKNGSTIYKFTTTPQTTPSLSSKKSSKHNTLTVSVTPLARMYETDYTLDIEINTHGKTFTYTEERQFTDFFTDKGLFLEDVFWAYVTQCYRNALSKIQ